MPPNPIAIYFVTVLIALLILAFVFIYKNSNSSNKTIPTTNCKKQQSTTTTTTTQTLTSLAEEILLTPSTSSRSNNNNFHQQRRRLFPPETDHLQTGECITYARRYRVCESFYEAPLNEKKKFFLEFVGDTNPIIASSDEQQYHQNNTNNKSTKSFFRQKEVALLRIHRIKKWSKDFWLNVCSWVTEANTYSIDPTTTNTEIKIRDAFLYTLDGHQDSVPEEFQPFVKIHIESAFFKIFFPFHINGFHRGDIGGAFFLHMNPQYSFCWLFESDTRFGGTSWARFFKMATTTAKENADMSPKREMNPELFGGTGESEDAHLIFFYPRFLNYGYDVPKKLSKNPPPPAWRVMERQSWLDALYQTPIPKNPARSIKNIQFFANRSYFAGEWRRSLQNTVWVGAFLPAMGMSRELGLALIHENFDLKNGHLNQEVNTPLAAQIYGLKIVSLAGSLKPKEDPVFKMYPLPRKNMSKKEIFENKEFIDDYANNDKYFIPFQFYYGWTNRSETSPLYAEWAWKTLSISEEASLKFMYHCQRFAGGSCLEDVLFHPIKF